MFSFFETHKAILEFVTKIKEKVGQIHTEAFMSDDANQYHEAWKDAMESKPEHKVNFMQHILLNYNSFSISDIF